MRHRDLLDRDLVERFHRRLRLTDRTAEGREVVMPDQMRRALAHRRDVEGVQNLPDPTPIMHDGGPPRDETEKIASFDCRKTRVKVIGDARASDDRDRSRLEMEIQRLGQAERIPVLAQIGMGDLRGGMNPGIGASRGRDRMCPGFEPRQRGLDRALHGRLVRLALPASERSPVIFDLERISRHQGRIARSGRSGNPRADREGFRGRSDALAQRPAMERRSSDGAGLPHKFRLIRRPQTSFNLIKISRGVNCRRQEGAGSPFPPVKSACPCLS